ncbi:Uma2 family endonuclease [Tumidithrix elongata RA019]|uniref:Uma2 family endonuclease n=1 Tax=Tumidithrix elongata BACA0141 TaxID=2716417 RepID=A0AAW9PY49_9CYAN|nr:Uma2 family endonuclease [Tumidithrix elongata RA019]
MTISGDRKLISNIELPDEDFEPMPEGDKQRRNLSYATEALRLWFEKKQNVYVSGNLFIRYQEDLTEKRIAPDIFVVFGMSNEDRVSYKIGKEDGKVPDFVLELTSKGTVTKDREQNPLIYRALGVKEYFQYDPSGEYLKPTSLQGVRLENGKYVAIAVSTLPDGTLSLHSEVLGLELHMYPDLSFRFYDPISNQVLRSYAEAEHARFQAELERSFEQQARIEAEAIAEQERNEKLQERLAKQLAEQKAQRLAERLRALGLDPDEI